MRSFVRSSLGVVGLLLAACGSDGAGSSATTPASVPTSSATTRPATTGPPVTPVTTVPVTTVPVTTGPTTTVAVDTSSTFPVVPNGLAPPLAINSEGEMLFAVASGIGWIQPSLSALAVVLDTRTGEQREMPTGGVNVSASGMNDAGLVAGYYTREVRPCPAAVSSPVNPFIPNYDCPIVEAFVWDSVGGGITSLPEWAAVAGPNAAGLVVVVQDPDGPESSDLDRVAVWDSTTGDLTSLEGGPAILGQQLGGRVARINDLGQVLGLARGDGVSIVIWDTRTGSSDPLGPYKAAEAVPVLLGFDNAGTVLVFDSLSSGSYVWDPLSRRWQQLVGTLNIDSSAGGTRGSVATAMSSSGLVAGLSWEPAAGGNRPRYGVQVWDLDTGQPPQSIGLGDLDYAMPTFINDRGQIIAFTGVPEGCLYDPTTDTWNPLGS